MPIIQLHGWQELTSFQLDSKIKTEGAYNKAQ
jgi:hypothetical protein